MRLILCSLLAAIVPFGRAADRSPVPAGAVLRLEFDKAEYVLGENILVHAILANEGAEPIRASFGGDYRALGRADRYKFTVTAADGTVLPDPLERLKGRNLGGLGGSPELSPGERFVDSLPLCDFVHLPRAGSYRVQVTHDFGWSSGERKHPVAEATIAVRLPSAEEAEALVASAATEKFSGGTFGKRSPPHASYAALYHPIFLPALRRRAEQLDRKAISAIDRIETPDATETLIGMLGSPAAEASADAARRLDQRVPFFHPPEPPDQVWADEKAAAAARIFAERCWKAELAESLAARARQWVLHGAAEQRERGISFLGRVGDGRDIAEMLKAIESELIALRKFDSDDFVSDPPRVCRAAVAALRRLNPKPDEIQGDAGRYFRISAAPPGKARPEDLRAALESPRPVLRQAALQALPDPLPKEFRDAVREALEDADAGVCSAAAEVGTKDKHPSYRPALVTLLATERNVWALRSATTAALALDARFEAAQAWVAQLDHPQHWHTALTELVGIVVGSSSGSGSSRAERDAMIALRARWERFLAKHDQDIRKGRVFEPGEAVLPADLFAPYWQIQRKDGTRWPPKE